MRNIYNIRGTITEDSNLFGLFAKLIPEIVEVDMDFRKANFSNITEVMDGNILEELTVKFKNNNVLKLEGKYFHMFYDSVPFAVEDKDGGYFKVNPFLDNYSTAKMIELIRKSFIALLCEIDIKKKPSRIKKISLVYTDFSTRGEMDITTLLYPELDDSAIAEVKNQMTQLFKSPVSFQYPLKQFIENALLKPRIKRELVRENEMIRNSFNKVEWGDVSLMEFKSFLMELDSNKEANIPYFTRYEDRLKDELKEYTVKAMQIVVDKLICTNPVIMKHIHEFYLISNYRYPSDSNELAKFLADEDGPGFKEFLFDYYYEKYFNSTIAELLKNKHI